MSTLPSVHLTTRKAWRGWLARHHVSSRGVWLISWKKQTGKPAIPYNDAVEEALCFGWIDSIVRRVDDDRSAQKYTPRQTGSLWSQSNVRRFERLVASGAMTAAGLVHRPTAAAKRAAIDNRAAGALSRLPSWIEASLKTHRTAWKNFAAMTDAQRGLYVRWLEDAKKDETRQRRLASAVARLERNERL